VLTIYFVVEISCQICVKITQLYVIMNLLSCLIEFPFVNLPISTHSFLILRNLSPIFVLNFNSLFWINQIVQLSFNRLSFLRCSGWHICSSCQKASHYMCYTCTYSLCKGCIKNADFVSVRGNKGLCGICKKTIMLIENSAQGNKEMVCLSFLSTLLISLVFLPLSLSLMCTKTEWELDVEQMK